MANILRTPMHRPKLNRLIVGDAREVLRSLPNSSVDLSFWSPPYFVGKSYEKHLSFSDWCSLIKEAIALHKDIVKPGGFLCINIADILCFSDPDIPKIQADNILRKRVPVTREDILNESAEIPKLLAKI